MTIVYNRDAEEVAKSIAHLSDADLDTVIDAVTVAPHLFPTMVVELVTAEMRGRR
jgi:hypothetical protein